MTITSRLFEAFLKCPTKCFLRSIKATTTGNEYADWIGAQQARYQSDGIQALRQGVTPDRCITGPLHMIRGKPSGWHLAIDCLASAHNLESAIHAVERVPSEARNKAEWLIPIRFTLNNRLSKDDGMLVAFDAFVLSEMLGSEVGLGKIIHGGDRATRRVKTGDLAGTVRKLTERISTLLSTNSPPDLVLNRHCPECECQNRCRQKAIETNDLSLLSGISENERNSQRSKGIFTVMQLSYTFRPRKTPKRAQNPTKPRYMALQARAIRENTVYMHGRPRLPDSKTLVYLDIEGLPDSESYYLIGALAVSEAGETFHSFWADQKADEKVIFAQFAETIGDLPDSRILHFGDYESVALKRMRARLPENLRAKINTILDRMTNVLSIIHPHLYFPTYANSLKDIGRFLGYKRADEVATGLQTIVWRNSWEVHQAADTKARLLQYNQDDCHALKHIYELIRRLASPGFAVASIPQISFKTTETEDLPKTRPRWGLFAPKKYASEDLKKVAQCAYFDYQRDRVFVRSYPSLKVVNRRRRKFRHASNHVNRVQAIECQRCPQCQSRKIEKRKQLSHDVIDLKFFNGGMKRWVTRIMSWRYRCLKCKHDFNSEERPPSPPKYGHGLYSWCVYANVARGMNMLQVEKSLGECFGLKVPSGEAYRSKSYFADVYRSLYREILKGIQASPVIHIDETAVRLRNCTGYVWVMASIDEVYYFYRPSREGSFLEEMIGSFSGVLVSDFYTAYDSLPFAQQKCLVHLLRDIDDDLLRNPLDSEFKNIGHGFATLLRTIIETVDKFGLKCRHLHKHKRSAMRFLRSVAGAEFSSPLAIKYQKRFQKSGEKMFTFLGHDGVPWNNTNAEHAIKRFAKYRRHADGRLTERSLKEYLVLASVLETCALNSVNALQFLLSKQITLEGLIKMAGRRAKTSGGVRMDDESERGCQSGCEPNPVVVSTKTLLHGAVERRDIGIV